jgi:hypothetical protein
MCLHVCIHTYNMHMSMYPLIIETLRMHSCACMYAYIHTICIWACTRWSLRRLECIYVLACMHTYIQYAYEHVPADHWEAYNAFMCLHACIHTYTQIDLLFDPFLCTRMYTYTYMHAHIHTVRFCELPFDPFPSVLSTAWAA